MKTIGIFCMIVGCLLSFCSQNSNPASSSNPDPNPVSAPTVCTPLQVSAQIQRSIEYDGFTPGFYDTFVECNVDVQYSNTTIQSKWDTTAVGIGTAVVTINGTLVPRFAPEIYDDAYELDMSSSSYIPGATYQLSVTYNGETYSQTLTASGGFTANSSMTNIQWSRNDEVGNGEVVTLIDVGYLFGSTTYTTHSTTSLTSPCIIPAKAYPDTGTTYSIAATISNSINFSFGSLVGRQCDYSLADAITWRYTN